MIINNNKDNIYILYKVVYDENIDDYNYYEILPEISVEKYRDMSYDEKEKYFNGGNF